MAYFSDDIIEQIWAKAKAVDGYDNTSWRQDFAGAWICRNGYGQSGKYGWVIDHLKPLSLGGKDTVDNLIAIHWINNQVKVNKYPCFDSKISSDGKNNVINIQHWRINDADNK